MNSAPLPDLQNHPPTPLPFGLGLLAVIGGFQGLLTVAFGLFLVLDRNDSPVLLADSIWPLEYAKQQTPGLVFHDVEPL